MDHEAFEDAFRIEHAEFPGIYVDNKFFSLPLHTYFFIHIADLFGQTT